MCGFFSSFLSGLASSSLSPLPASTTSCLCKRSLPPGTPSKQDESGPLQRTDGTFIQTIQGDFIKETVLKVWVGSGKTSKRWWSKSRQASKLEGPKIQIIKQRKESSRGPPPGTGVFKEGVAPTCSHHHWLEWSQGNMLWPHIPPSFLSCAGTSHIKPIGSWRVYWSIAQSIKVRVEGTELVGEGRGWMETNGKTQHNLIHILPKISLLTFNSLCCCFSL